MASSSWTWLLWGELHRTPTASYTVIGLYAAVIGFGASFNLAIVIALLQYRQRTLRNNVTNLFVLCLAVSDIVLCGVSMPLQVYFELATRVNSHTLCRLIYSSFGVPMYVSCLTILLIAIERYRLIVRPFDKRISFRLGLLLVAGVLFVSLVNSMPVGLFVRANYCVLNCQENWPNQALRLAYSCIIFTVLFLLPLLVCASLYLAIYRRLARRPDQSSSVGVGVGSDSSAGLGNREAERRKRRTTGLLVGVVVCFTVSWAPWCLFSLVTEVDRHKTRLGDLNPLVRVFTETFDRAESRAECDRLVACMDRLLVVLASRGRRDSLDTEKPYSATASLNVGVNESRRALADGLTTIDLACFYALDRMGTGSLGPVQRRPATQRQIVDNIGSGTDDNNGDGDSYVGNAVKNDGDSYVGNAVKNDGDSYVGNAVKNDSIGYVGNAFKNDGDSYVGNAFKNDGDSYVGNAVKNDGDSYVGNAVKNDGDSYVGNAVKNDGDSYVGNAFKNDGDSYVGNAVKNDGDSYVGNAVKNDGDEDSSDGLTEDGSSADGLQLLESDATGPATQPARLARLLPKGRPYLRLADLILKLFAMSSACINPFLYGWLNEAIRDALLRQYGRLGCLVFGRRRRRRCPSVSVAVDVDVAIATRRKASSIDKLASLSRRHRPTGRPASVELESGLEAGLEPDLPTDRNGAMAKEAKIRANSRRYKQRWRLSEGSRFVQIHGNHEDTVCYCACWPGFGSRLDGPSHTIRPPHPPSTHDTAPEYLPSPTA
ncbi:unnamed protein product [Protopolystoma xenopodis]|uniref:G-protein coupled receptors family 1 profile domain-containing protein n=1 Tax=Protopolystoma xenopodis TaxID=117903 RepID=A0A448WAU2_9PLAT|nr:unnamed protein product [Protopolystoma xenopodis]